MLKSFDRNVLTESFDRVFFLDPCFEFGGPGLGWGLAGLGWAGLGAVGCGGGGGLGRAALGCGWAGLGWAGLGWPGLAWAGLGAGALIGKIKPYYGHIKPL